MATTAVLAEEFGPDQIRSLALAGTVRIPQPIPASGALYLVLNPGSNPAFPAGSPRFLVKHVQTVARKQVVTRYVDLDEVSAVELSADASGDSGTGSWSIYTVDEERVASTIQSAQKELDRTAKKANELYEQILFPDAAIHVREAAPVFLRIVYEFGVTAAEAASHVGVISSHTMNCC